jgi:hypothetical protein
VSIESPSPYSRPRDGLRVIPGAPAPQRPPRDQKEAIEARLKSEAQMLVMSAATEQATLVQEQGYDLSWMKGRHFLLAGATGQGLGGALATAILSNLGDKGTLTAVSRDIKLSLGHYSGAALKEKSEDLGVGDRFRFLDRGIAVEGKEFDKLVENLKDLNASDVVYCNMVAAANSGLMPGMPPIYVPDLDDEGLFQWELQPLDERQIAMSRSIMGEMAVAVPQRLAESGVSVQVEGYAGWRGSHDKISRLPERVEYGRQGPYSGSLWLPKDVLDAHVDAAIDKDDGRVVQVHFFPVMKTRALGFIPGGNILGGVMDTIMAKERIKFIGINELALMMLDRIGKALAGNAPCPWQRHDLHEVSLDDWFYHILERLTDDESSPYFYKTWMGE